MSALLPLSELLPKTKDGLIFSAPLVPPVLDGSKDLTRRMSKKWLRLKVGDLIFVRENWRLASYDMAINWDCRLIYEADGASLIHKVPGEHVVWLDREADRRADYRRKHGGDTAPLRPSIFLPKWAARCVLRITEPPRLERVQDITEEDAKREGVTPFPYDPGGDQWTDGKYRTAFEYTWGKLHGFVGEKKPGEAWSDNPLVVRLAFERAG